MPDKDEYKIWFDSISMEFPGVLALDNVSFGVKKGTVHIMMGENGAGKSTLMKILNGTHIPTGGKFYVENKEMKFQSTIEAEKNGIAMIYQELNYIPDMTVERYLMLCREPKKGVFIDWKGVSRIASQILKEEGLDYNPKSTLREHTVSEIQLLEITRAIRGKDVDILIMDEATSNLDSITERAIENTINESTDGITTIIIAHRLSTIMKCDKIYVLDKGKIIESGSHKELMAKGGFYYELWKEQIPDTADIVKEHKKIENNDTVYPAVLQM